MRTPAVLPIGDASTSPIDATLESDVRIARQVALLMDAQFSVAGVRFGADAILGLIPGIGDLVGLAIGFVPILVARKHRLGNRLAARMLANLAIDCLVGSVPVAGDAFDVFFRANLKNVDLLEAAVRQRRSHAR